MRLHQRARYALGAGGIYALLAVGCSGSNFAAPGGVGTGASAFERGAPSAPHWSPIGPVVRHGSAGKLNAFVFVASNPSVMLVAGGWGNTPRESPSQAGIYRTTDGGLHWQTADDGLTNPDGTISSVVNGLWIDQERPAIVLASTEFGGTYRSTDGGRSWKNVDPSESTQFAQVGSTLYLASRRGVLKTNDDGSSWTVSLPSSSGATSVVTAAGATFAGDEQGNVFRLRGSQWQLVGHAGFGAIHDIAIDPFDTRVVYANVDDVDAWNQNLYGSIDGGRTFGRVICHCEVGAQAIAFSLVVPRRLYLGDDGSGVILYFTADGSEHPKIHRGGSTKANDVRYIYPEPGKTAHSEVCYFVSDQGLFYDASCTSGPADGLTNGVANFLAYDVSLPSGAENAVVPLQDWNAIAGPVGGALQFMRGASEGGESFDDPYANEACYFAHPDVGLAISSDGCASFSSPLGSGIESLAFLPPDGATMYAVRFDDRSRGRISSSEDGGKTWHVAFDTFARPYQIVVSPLDRRSLLVAGGNARLPNYVDVSHDGGATWHASRGLPASAPAIEQYFPAHQYYAAFDPTQRSTILLADHDPATNDVLIFRSTDDGATFVQVHRFVQPPTQRPWPSFELPREDEHPSFNARYYTTRFYANRIAYDAGVPRGCRAPVVVTTRFGAFLSADGTRSWRRIDAGAVPHHFIGATWVGGALYLASFGEGVLKSTDVLNANGNCP